MVGKTTESNDNIEHNTVNFVDDSGSVITFKDENDAREYTQTNIDLLEQFYNMNKLRINSEKTAILLFKNNLELYLFISQFIIHDLQFFLSNTQLLCHSLAARLQ